MQLVLGILEYGVKMMATQTNCQTNGLGTIRRDDYSTVIIVAWFAGIVLIAFGLWLIPWKSYETHTMKLLPATMGELNEAYWPISVSLERFLTLARGEQVIMVIEKRDVPVVIYEVIFKDTSFRYYKYAPQGIRYSASGEYEIGDGVLTLVYPRSKVFMGFAVMVAVVGGIVIFVATVYGLLEWRKERTAASETA